ncbi:MAG: PKD domain-containing protein [Acidobacteria bacterium]|nr:PKD domain-containing protein [Acidobacteriota bacterium]
MLTRRLIVLGLLAAAAGCALDKQAPPALSGPSELGLSLAVSATPDVVTQDGRSQATIEIVARDGNSQPVRTTVRAEMLVDGVAMDFGTLSNRSVSTGADGRASIVYQAPPAPPATVTKDTIVTVAVTPVGGDYASAVARTVAIRLTRPGVILPPTTAPGAPVPDFFFSPTTPREDDEVLFDSSASTDPDGEIVSYRWTFGDGGSANGVRVSNQYDFPGTYKVVLTVTDDAGRVASATKDVQVGTATAPTVDFTFSPTEPIVDQAVNFNATMSKAAAGRHISGYDWDWGDGTPHGTGVTATHAFGLPGTFTVVLHVTDDSGQDTAVSKTIKIETAKPKADFSVSPPTATAGVTAVTFNGSLSTAPAGRTITGYAWDFGDGTTSTAAAPAHTYAAPGTFTVVLTVTDSAGATGITSKTVSVTP